MIVLYTHQHMHMTMRGHTHRHTHIQTHTHTHTHTIHPYAASTPTYPAGRSDTGQEINLGLGVCFCRNVHGCVDLVGERTARKNNRVTFGESNAYGACGWLARLCSRL